MRNCHITDTFPDFLSFWQQAEHKSTDAQIAEWQSRYMAKYPELLEKQIACYSEENIDWQQIARQKIFPSLAQRLGAMKVARENLLTLLEPIYSKTRETLDFERSVYFVLYVGVGCGAGWATTFHNLPAALFGLENIAECGWTGSSSLTGLAAHELGHLIHLSWRKEAGMPQGSGPFWQLYSEGFAQLCEHIICGKDSWHMLSGINDPDWLGWCQRNKCYLAAHFLEIADTSQTVRPFFGHWFDIKGRKQCGHFLGHELIKVLQTSKNIREVALLDNVDQLCRTILQDFTRSTSPER